MIVIQNETHLRHSGVRIKIQTKLEMQKRISKILTFRKTSPGNDRWGGLSYLHTLTIGSVSICEAEINFEKTTAFWGTRPCKQLEVVKL